MLVAKRKKNPVASKDLISRARWKSKRDLLGYFENTGREFALGNQVDMFQNLIEPARSFLERLFEQFSPQNLLKAARKYKNPALKKKKVGIVFAQSGHA